jgi:two-component system sensor histidine kinase KdpD
MEHVLHNLIHNAILYTPEKSIVSIQVENAQNACVFHISDNGPGIPQEDKFQVFEKFFRLPGNRAGGSGLGLSIVKGFVEAHQGRIELQDAPQGGAYFKVYIPAEKSYITNLKNE